MKTKAKIWIYPLALMVVLFMFVSGCKKGETLLNKSETARNIGDSYGGGIIFKIHWDGHYIYYIAATSDQSKSARWDTACVICSLRVLNGYSDWRLPLDNDLMEMYAQRNFIGGFGNGYYWSCDGNGSDIKPCINFKDGSWHSYSKDSTFCVRVIRGGI